MHSHFHSGVLAGYATVAHPFDPVCAGIGSVHLTSIDRATLVVETGRAAIYQGPGTEARTLGAGRTETSAGHRQQADQHHTSAGG